MVNSNDDNITLERLALWAVMLPIFAAMVGACVIWAYQATTFLQAGYWPAYSSNAGLHFLTGARWFVAPDSWLGVHRMLEFLNAGVALILAAFVAAPIAAAVAPKQ